MDWQTSVNYMVCIEVEFEFNVIFFTDTKVFGFLPIFSNNGFNFFFGSGSLQNSFYLIQPSASTKSKYDFRGSTDNLM